MKRFLLLVLMIAIVSVAEAQKISWVYSTETAPWTKGTNLSLKVTVEKADITINPADTLQQMEGFGACFNELGWEALLSIPETGREKVLQDLFSKDGANFTYCRIPVASNDYSLSYYSYNDVAEDFAMRNFNIDRDRYILIPYIKAARKIVPELKIWASPWSPPAWMKSNNHYSMGPGGPAPWNTDMNSGKKISNNATAFIMQDRYLDAYSLYLSKFVQAYKKEGIPITRLLVQNEMVYQPHWQSCTWRPEDMAFFIGKYLGPRFKKDSLKSEIWLGTVNSSDPDFSRTIMNDKDAAAYIKGIGMQWDAKNTIATIHKEYSALPLMQTESECGNGENNWKSAEYTWSLIYQYISNGVGSYVYWNMVLDETGRSTWGWVQNTLISIDKTTGKVRYNPEYYLMKHLSHYVLPGAHLLKTDNSKDHLVFRNPDGEIVILLINTEAVHKEIAIRVEGRMLKCSVQSKSINTFVWPMK